MAQPRPNATPPGVPPADAWKRVWEGRRLDPSRGTILSQLIAADGFDSPFAQMDEPRWVAFVRRRAAELGIHPGMSIFEVGCGAGAFLHELQRVGCTVGGIDQSATLVGFARMALPQGRFAVGDAVAIDITEPVDVVLSCSVLQYFPSQEYARAVVERMVTKARRAVAILDVPDRATQDAALRYRRAAMGPDEGDAPSYDGLDHQYYDRDWLMGVLRESGLRHVRSADQDIAGYGNGPFRFNALGFRAG